MKKMFLAAVLAAAWFAGGCAALTSPEAQGQIQEGLAKTARKLAGTDELGAKFDAAAERAELTYAFVVLAAEKQGITETQARDWLAGRSESSESSETSEAPAADVDAIEFGKLQWEFGGVKGGKAELSSPRLSGLKAGAKSLSYKWEEGLGDWGLARDDAGALACFFVEREDGSIVGGKFDWVSTSRSTRGLENVFNGYGGWTLKGVPNPCKVYFVVITSDGRKRTNVVGAEWKR